MGALPRCLGGCASAKVHAEQAAAVVTARAPASCSKFAAVQQVYSTFAARVCACRVARPFSKFSFLLQLKWQQLARLANESKCISFVHLVWWCAV